MRGKRLMIFCNTLASCRAGEAGGGTVWVLCVWCRHGQRA